MSRLEKLYTSMLQFAGLSVNKDGFVHADFNGKSEPFMIDAKQVVIPTKEHLKNGVNKCLFHPLRENIIGGESAVIKAYRNALALRFNTVASTIGQFLLLAASSSDATQKLSTDTLELATALGDIDEKTAENYNRVVLAGLKKDPYKNFVGLFLKKGDSLMGKRYARVCIATFPIYEQLVENAEKVNGVKIRVKDYDALIKLYRFMLPGIEDQHTYSDGSDSKVAPFTESLMKSAMKIASSLNTLLENYSKYIDDAESLMFDGSWLDEFRNLNDLDNEISRIPSQAGNRATDEPEIETVAPVQMQRTVALPQVQQTIPVPQMQPTPARTDGKVSVKELLASNPATQVTPNPLGGVLYPPPPPMYPQQYPPQMPMGGAPMYPQQYPQFQQPYPQQMQPQMQQPMYPQYPPQMPMGGPPGQPVSTFVYPGMPARR